jgi:hypothetical protein
MTNSPLNLSRIARRRARQELVDTRLAVTFGLRNALMIASCDPTPIQHPEAA